MNRTIAALVVAGPICCAAPAACADQVLTPVEPIVVGVDVSEAKQSRHLEQYTLAVVTGGRPGEISADKLGYGHSHLKLWAARGAAKTTLAFEYDRTNTDKSSCTAHGEFVVGATSEKLLGARLPCGTVEDLSLVFTLTVAKK